MEPGVSRNGTVGSFEQLYRLFEKRCTAKKVKPSTMDQYARTMGRFVRWADDQGMAPAELESIDVLHYTGTLVREDGQPYKTESLRGHCRNLKTLLNFAADYKVIPAKIKVEMPKPEEDELKALNDQELAKVVAYVEARAESFPRDAAIVHVLKDSGLRAGELVALNWSDILWDEERQLGTIKVNKQMNRKREIVSVKNGKPRETFFYADAWRYLVKHLKETAFENIERAAFDRIDQGLAVNEWPEGDYKISHVFGRTKGSNRGPGRLGNSGLGWMLEQIGKEIGIKLHPHLFRHTSGRLMTIAGLSPIVIMQILGHSDLTMVMRYSRLWGPDVANVVAEAMTGNGSG